MPGHYNTAFNLGEADIHQVFSRVAPVRARVSGDRFESEEIVVLAHNCLQILWARRLAFQAASLATRQYLEQSVAVPFAAAVADPEVRPSDEQMLFNAASLLTVQGRNGVLAPRFEALEQLFHECEREESPFWPRVRDVPKGRSVRVPHHHGLHRLPAAHRA
eukprot:CAMPEP_0185269170 /NCGR_PEP_ID=MMETSP1359-20130426/39036_1 /TAXON_ID=552665 /ORGANISM="Bigelowiella longifila, Strain CCMP242" /LENGTH=161 /DNA_ID=CAMNT_0027860215 /DNA_START=60 /DNA_END=546 /DNA_ORIENTATION=+